MDVYNSIPHPELQALLANTAKKNYFKLKF